MTPKQWATGWLQLAAVVAGGVTAYQHRADLVGTVERNKALAAAGFHFLVAGGFLVAAGRFVVDRWRFVRRAGRATGRVVAVRRTVTDRDDGSAVDWFVPTIRFRAGTREVEIPGPGAGTNDVAGWRVGKRVPILYAVADPTNALIDDRAKWKPVVGPLLFAAVCAGFGLAFLLLSDAGGD